jgi:hypothetical protein
MRTMTASRRHRAQTALAIALLSAGAVTLSACSSSGSSTSTTASTAASGSSTPTTAGGQSGSGGSASSLAKISQALQKGQSATFKAVYTIDEGGSTKTLTFAQAPPKSLISTDGTTIISDGSKNLLCTTDSSSDPAGQTSCVSTSGASPVDSLKQLINPTTIISEIKGFENQVAARAAGVSVTKSAQTIAGVPSTCASIAVGGTKSTYCAADDSGVLTQSSSAGTSLTLTEFTTTVPDSLFQPPAGATVETIPGT